MHLILILLLLLSNVVNAGLISPPYDFTPLDSNPTFSDDGVSLTVYQTFYAYQALKDVNAASGYSSVGMAECSRTAHDINDYNNLCYLPNTGNAILGTFNAYPLNQNYPMTGLHNSHVRDILSWLSNPDNSPVENPHKLFVRSILAIRDMTLWHLNYSELLAADYYLECNSGTKILIYQSRGYHGAIQTYDDRASGKSLACPTGVAPPDRVPVNLLPKPPTDSSGTNPNSGGAANSGASGTSGLASTGIANDAESATDAAVVAEIRAVDQNLPLLNVLTTIKDSARKSPSCAYYQGCYNCLDYAESFYRTSGGSVSSYQSNIFSCLDMAFAATKSKATTYYPSSGTPNPAAKPTDYLKNTGTASAADNASDKYALSLLDNASTALVARDAAKQSASCEASEVCKSCVSAAFSVSEVKKCVTDAMSLSKSALPSAGTGTGTTGTGTTGTGSAGTGTGTGSNGTGTGASSGNCSPAGTGASGTGTPAKGTVCLSFEDAINQCYGLDSLGNSLGAGNKWSDTLAAYADAKCVDLPSDKPAAGKREGNIAFYYNGVFAYKSSGGGIWSYSCSADVPAKPAPRDPKTGKPIDPCASPTAGSSGSGNGSGNGATSSDIKGLQDATTKGLSDVGTKIDGTNKLLTSSNTKLDTIANNTGATAKNTEAINKGIDKLVAGQCGGKDQPACKIDVGNVPTASTPTKDAACKTADCYGAQIDQITGDISKALFPQGTPLTCATPACVSAHLEILDTEVQFCYDMLGQILTILGTIFKLLAYFYAIRILLTYYIVIIDI